MPLQKKPSGLQCFVLENINQYPVFAVSTKVFVFQKNLSLFLQAPDASATSDA